MAKPLARFKCVSRNWNSLISDSGFMKSRARRAIILPVQPFLARDNNVSSKDMAYSMVKLPSPFVPKEFCIRGTFEGLVLLVRRCNGNSDHMILYSPLTRDSKIVPYPLVSNCMKLRAYREILLPNHAFQAIDITDDFAYTTVKLRSPFIGNILYIVGTFNGVILLVVPIQSIDPSIKDSS